MPTKTIDDVNISGKTVLLRADFNTPLTRDEHNRRIVADDSRIVASIPTIQNLLYRGCKVVICSHLGRPGGDFDFDYSLLPVATLLEEHLGVKVNFASDCAGPSAANALKKTDKGEVCLLENLRFYLGETENDPLFSKVLASYADAYVNDAFGSCHRRHASVYGVVKHLTPAVAGHLVAKEMDFFEKLLYDPQRPFVMVIGGFKLSTKLAIVQNALKVADKIIIGGGMAYTFLKAAGGEVGISPVEGSYVEEAKKMLQLASDKILLPIDRVCAPRYNEAEGAVTTDDANVPEGLEGVDIGPKTVELFTQTIKKAGSVFWNGPMGVFETPGFEKGTQAVAAAIAENDGFTVIGGGDSVYAIKMFGFEDDDFTHIGTGGGASLNYMGNGSLPAIDVLDKKDE